MDKCLLLSAILLMAILGNSDSAVSAAKHFSKTAWQDPHDLVPPPREDVVFDYGWRFRFGHAPDGAPGPGDTNFTNIANFGCSNMEHNPNRYTADDCMIACAYNPQCLAWQLGGGCQHGGVDSQCSASMPHKAPLGGQRKSAPPTKTTYDFAKQTFDDSQWTVLDVPHDFVVTGDFVDMPDSHHGYLPRNVSWYRKHFHLPSDWKASHIHIHFEGVFHVAQVWVNGQYVQMHNCGYTGFTVRLDNVTGLEYGTDAANVVAVRTDATFGSGHWYEGGGIYRRTHLVRMDPTHFVHDGVFVDPEVNPASPTASVKVSGEIETTSSNDVSYDFYAQLYTMAGDLVSTSSHSKAGIKPGYTRVVTVDLPVNGTKAWSIQEPNLYEIRVFLNGGDVPGVLDSQNLSVGFRETSWSGSSGFRLNDHALKFRGFSHHNSFTGVGVAIPDRIHLFRAQASRAVGGSFWRMSHNPYLPALYNFLDVLGVLTWDENRDYGLEYVGAMHEMVKRDRSHPSIVVWSYCNEVECGQVTNQTGLAFRAAAKALDPQRPTAANGGTDGIDVQGMSHARNESFENFHKKDPDMPLVLSECCSCQTQRMNRGETTTCMHDQNSPGLLPYVAGSLGVWTLFDYYGESHSWPSVTSSYGNFDLAGFPKPHAYWYVLNWLAKINASDYGRPPVTVEQVTRILDLPGQVTGSVAVLSSGAEVELYLDGKLSGKKETMGSGEPLVFDLSPSPPTECTFNRNLSVVQCHGLTHASSAESPSECQAACCKDLANCRIWQYSAQHSGCWIGNVPVSTCTETEDTDWVGGGNIVAMDEVMATSLDAKGISIGNFTLKTAKEAAGIQLTLDVPSVSTGTGAKLVLDGHDAALVKAAIVDDNGLLVTGTSVNVTFSVVSGPGRLIGVGNGDNACHQNAKSDHVPTYGGLARGIFQVTTDCVSERRARNAQVDIDHGPTKVEQVCTSTDSIVIQATSAGLKSATLTIEVSGSADDLPLNVAKQSVNLEGYTYLSGFEG